MLAVLFPVAQWITRSWPDGNPAASTRSTATTTLSQSKDFAAATRTGAFWLILFGSTAILFAIGSVISNFILYLRDQKFDMGAATTLMFGLLVASLAGRVLVGHIAEHYRRKNVMALFYLVLAGSVPLLLLAGNTSAIWTFALVFGFAMGADYMLIPLVTADCFGISALGKLLAAIIMADSLGQFYGPKLAGRIYDTQHTYAPAWWLCTVVGIAGAALIFFIKRDRQLDRT
jgi:MFS family permease